MTIRPSRLVASAIEPDARVANGLLLAFVVLLPAEPLYNAPLIALAMLGAMRLVFRRVRVGSPEHRFLVVAFLSVWIPMLASLPDAVNPIESIRKTASLCIFFLAGVYAVEAYTRFRDLDWIMTGVAAICVFWTLDALWQFHTGVNWFGMPPHRDEENVRLTGVFPTGRIGSVLAGFAPIFFEAVRRMTRRWWWSPVLLAPFLLTIILSGSRASWGVLVVGAAGYFLFLVRWSDRPRRHRGGAVFRPVAMVLAVVLAAYASAGGLEQARKFVEPRVERLAGLWSGDRAQAERAVSWRLSIWETALNMWSEHWLNGVGPRGFRYAYREYNPERDYYLEANPKTIGGKSPHMQLLGIAAETGVIGLLGYVLLAVYFVVRLRRLDPGAFRSVYPYALTLILVLFPFNGKTLYSVLSMALIWWTVIICACAFAIASRTESRPAPFE